VEHKYNTERKRVVEEREIPGQVRDLKDCNCEHPVRAYGMATAEVREVAVLVREIPHAAHNNTEADNSSTVGRLAGNPRGGCLLCIAEQPA
jgi:hypothetical protein